MMRVDVFYEKGSTKELCLLIPTCSRIEENELQMSHFLENNTLNKFSFPLIVTTNMFVLELSQCSKQSKLSKSCNGHQC